MTNRDKVREDMLYYILKKNQTYEEVFVDHFDGILDTSNWTILKASTNKPCLSTENSYTENGNYVAKIDDVVCPLDLVRNARSGGIKTKKEWLYGYFEVRAKVAAGAGINSSFWLCRTSSWPPEIDVYETAGYDDIPDKIYMSIHYDTDNKSMTKNFVGPDYSLDYHIFAVEWTENYINYYIDNILRNTFITPESMRVSMGVRLTISKGWGTDNWPAIEILPKYMYVDYLKVYQRRNKQMVDILTNVGYISTDKLKEPLATIVSRPQTFSTTVQHAMTDVNNGKTFSIPNFPKSCIIKEIRIRSNFISGLQIWRIAFVNNANGITPADTSISCQTAEIFQVGDCIYIEEEMAYVSAVDVANSTITVTRGIKGTTASYHNFGARMETANDGLRIIFSRDNSRKLSDRLRIMKDLMSWKGNTSAAIAANDKVIKFANSPSNLSKYDFLYIIDGNNSERASVEGTNKAVVNVAYNNMIYVADPLLAHAVNIEVQKQMIHDIPIIFSGGDGNLYGTLYVDEKLDNTLYPSGIIANIDVIVEIFYSK